MTIFPAMKGGRRRGGCLPKSRHCGGRGRSCVEIGLPQHFSLKFFAWRYLRDIVQLSLLASCLVLLGNDRGGRWRLSPRSNPAVAEFGVGAPN
jgi:hypothetical protein